MLKILVASGGMGALLWITSGSDASWLTGSTFDRAIRLMWIVALGAATYFAMLWGLGFRLKHFSKHGVR